MSLNFRCVHNNTALYEIYFQHERDIKALLPVCFKFFLQPSLLQISLDFSAKFPSSRSASKSAVLSVLSAVDRGTHSPESRMQRGNELTASVNISLHNWR